MDGKETALTYSYHYALMSVGSEIHGAFQSLVKSISVVPIVTHAVALGINPVSYTHLFAPRRWLFPALTIEARSKSWFL